MRNDFFLPWRKRRLMSAVLAVASLAVFSIAFLPVQAEAGSLVVPAWSFERGNGRIYANPAEYADAGPVVGGGEQEPWGWAVEYDIDIPVTAQYTLQICYSAAEVRPVEVFVDGKRLGVWCNGVTFAPASAGQAATPTWNSSGAKWEAVARDGKLVKLDRKAPLIKGKHTVKFSRRGPLPHLVALRLDTEAEFPEDWKAPRYTVRDIESVPVADRQAFSKVTALPQPIDTTSQAKAAGSLTIPAWTFDRGNATVYASPDQLADSGPMVGGGPGAAEQSVVEYDIDFPVTAEYTLNLRYAAAKVRPADIFLDGQSLGKCCTGITFSTSPYLAPARPASNSKHATWEGLLDRNKGTLLKLSVAKGKHTLKIARRGPLPNLTQIRLDSSVKFPSEWKQPQRKVDLSRVPAPQQAAFLPPDAINVAALRLALKETIKTFGPQYPKGPQYLKQLAELEAKQESAQEDGTPERLQEVNDSLAALRRDVMLAHPELNFDKLLFLKRAPGHYSHTYASQHAATMGSSLCVLSPVSPDGKVTPLVPELEGGLFDRFDLSFDAKKVAFGYKKSPEATFRIYEIDIDPVAGKMVPGSLRQLTFADEEEAEVMRRQICGSKRGFDDMYPCYLPNGKIMFASSRAQRIIFCAPNTATTLYLMDSDGKNVRRLSESPISETVPSLMDDGRVIYTRWEYVDKGLGNAETIWAMRPDGSYSDHVYKLNTVWPAGMSGARSIPGSRRIVTAAGNHYQPGVGPIVLLDTRQSRRSTDAMHCITPEIGYPPTYSPPKGFGAFSDPYPFSETFFLASHAPGPQIKKYGIYMLDAWGNRAELHQDAEMSCFEPIPLRPRRRPTEIAATKKVSPQQKTGTLFIQDVYQGMAGIERGRVKYVRVMGALEWPWDERGMSWSLGTDPHRKKIYGIAKVHEDGSAYFIAPADQNLLFQALDENYMALQQMSTFINLMPGENRSCIGCHEQRRTAPGQAAGRPIALDHPAQTLAPQPGDTGPRMIDYVADVQVTFNKYCVDCHSGSEPKGNLDLVGVPVGKFSRSFDTLLAGDLLSYRACRVSGRAHIRAVPPLTHGAIRSKLIYQLREETCKTNLTREEFIKIATWIDANVPYYGTYRGKVNPQDKDHPEFRMLPLAGK